MHQILSTIVWNLARTDDDEMTVPVEILVSSDRLVVHEVLLEVRDRKLCLSQVQVDTVGNREIVVHIMAVERLHKIAAVPSTHLTLPTTLRVSLPLWVRFLCNIRTI